MATSGSQQPSAKSEENLAVLNERLQGYVLRCKEIDEMKASLEDQLHHERNKNNSDKHATTAALKDELTTVRGDLSFATDQNDNLKRVEKEQHEELVLLRARLKKLEPLQDEVVSLRTINERQASELGEAKKRLSTAMTDASKYKEEMDKAVNNQNQIISKARVSGQETKALEKELKELKESREAEMAALRAKAAEVLHSSRADWKEEMDISVKQLEEKLKAQFEQTVEQQGKHMKELHVQVKSGRAELKQLSTSLASAVEEKQEIATLLKKEEDAHQASSLKMQKELDVMDAMVNGTRSRLVAKEEEFHTLMDAKIALENEIRVYKAILDNEERRLGSFSPKRKREDPTDSAATPNGSSSSSSNNSSNGSSNSNNNNSSNGSSKKSKKPLGGGGGGGGVSFVFDEAKDPAAPAAAVEGGAAIPSSPHKRTRTENAEGAVVVIEELCPATQRVVILNLTEQEQGLEGYRLSSETGPLAFTFPKPLQLPPHGRVTVWTGKKNKGKHNPPSDLFWTHRHVWNNQGDTAVLLRPSGEEVSRVGGGGSSKVKKGKKGKGKKVQETSDLLKDSIGFGGAEYPEGGVNHQKGECSIM